MGPMGQEVPISGCMQIHQLYIGPHSFVHFLAHIPSTKVDDDWVSSYTLMEVGEKISSGRPRKTWRDAIEDDLKRL
jgi:hypothetical protein